MAPRITAKDILRGKSCLKIDPVDRKRYQGLNILVTGATGSIGHALYAEFKSKGLTVTGIDHNEHAVATMPHIELCRFQEFERYEDFDVIFHAAAYKHVLLSEPNKNAFLDNNGIDVITLLEDLSKQKVPPSFVLVSSDKAAGESVLGKSKRLAEKGVLDYGNYFARSLRLVNCAYSHGSVLDLWSKGIRRLVSTDCYRYFMQTQDCIEALLHMPFVPVGIYSVNNVPSVSIHDLAEAYGGEFEPFMITEAETVEEKLFRANEKTQETDFPWLTKIIS